MVYLPHAFGIGTDASPRSIAFGNSVCAAPSSSISDKNTNYNSLPIAYIPSTHEQRRAVMAAKTKLKLSVLWGTRKLIAPSFYSFLNSDLQETTVRQLLINVVTVNICR